MENISRHTCAMCKKKRNEEFMLNVRGKWYCNKAGRWYKKKESTCAERVATVLKDLQQVKDMQAFNVMFGYKNV